MERLSRLLVENHDLQVRFRWNNRNDVGKSLTVPITLDIRNSYILPRSISNNFSMSD